MWRNDLKSKYMFMFPLKNLAHKGFNNLASTELPGGHHNAAARVLIL